MNVMATDMNKTGLRKFNSHIAFLKKLVEDVLQRKKGSKPRKEKV